MLVYTSMYWYVPVHTSTYCLILTGECVYLYILLYTVTSKYISVHTSSYQFILKQTGTYQHIPKHTSSYLSWSGFKKDANRFWTQDLLHTVRMLSHCTARVQTPDTGCVTMEMFVSILTLCIILPVYLTLDVGSTAPVPLRPRLRRPWRPQLLDWNLTIARPCLRVPQSAGFNWLGCHPDAVFKMQVTPSLAVPVPVPRPGAHWRPSQCVGPAFQLNTSTQKNNLIIEEATPAHQTCAQRSYLQSLER